VNRHDAELIALLARHGVARPLSARSAVAVGRWFTFKFRRNARSYGFDHAARQMKKLGVPHAIVRLILFGKL
jgi:hypothetical protein